MKTVTIIGGGIGGLTAGIALDKNGIDYEIYESTEEYKPVGAGIVLRTNAMQVCERLSLAEDIRKAGTDIAGIRTFSSSGETLAESDFRESMESKFGHVGAGIRRPALQDILLERTADEVIHMGKECVGLQEHGDQVLVEFADGSETEADIVIGADGTHSTVREAIFADVSIRYSNHVGHRGIPDIEVDHGNRIHQVWGDGISTGVIPLTDTRCYWFAVLNGRPGQEHDPEEVKPILEEKVRGMPAPIPTALSKTAPENIISLDYFDIPPLERWSSDRIALMGDAAHTMTPSLGQGGCQAIEDAYVLGQVLSAHDQPQEAVAEYEGIRLEKANDILAKSRFYGEHAVLDSYPKRVVRNLVYKYLVSRRIMPRLNERIGTINY